MNASHFIARCLPLAFGLVLARASAQVALIANVGPFGGAQDPVEFGRSIALQDSRMFVGVPRLKHDVVYDAGGVQIYTRVATGEWVYDTTLQPQTKDHGDEFGAAIATNGDWLLIGAPVDELAGGVLDAGLADVYQRQSGGAWTLRAHLVLSAAGTGDAFGSAVAVEPSRAVIGAPGRDVSAGDDGAAYVFEPMPGGAWQQVAALQPVIPAGVLNFGASVALHGDRVLVGATNADDGIAFVFERDASGAWSQVASLRAPDAAPNDMFATALALDGDRVAIGAPKHLHQSVKRGAVYVFERATSGAWSCVQELDSGDGPLGERFGASLALDGDVLIVGAPYNDTGKQHSGRAYRFVRDGAGAWTKHEAFSMPSAAKNAEFGAAVALSGDQLAIGAPGAPTALMETGRAFAYDVVPLEIDATSLSLAGGGSVTFSIEGGVANAGRPLLLFGSASGTAPGLLVAPGVVLPLNPDPYFDFTLGNPNHAPLAGSIQILGGGGHATASFSLPAGTSASLAGLDVSHAFLVFDIASGKFVFTSNARTFMLVP